MGVLGSRDPNSKAKRIVAEPRLQGKRANNSAWRGRGGPARAGNTVPAWVSEQGIKRQRGRSLQTEIRPLSLRPLLTGPGTGT